MNHLNVENITASDIKSGYGITFTSEKYNKGKRTSGNVKRVFGDSLSIVCMNGRSRVILNIADMNIIDVYYI